MADTVLAAEGLSKKFCRNLRRALWYGAVDIASEMTGLRRESHILRKGEFWALRDVSFQLGRGEVLGLIGPNGAGKTTLLRLLNGLIKPDEGRIRIRGRVGALIELGAGFNPILSGRENVYVNAAILGIPKREIDQRLESIIDFSGLRQFVDTPVQSYSSGMRVRLGFAVAINLQPDIMLVDEVLAVGDMEFRNKCLDAIRRMRDSGVAFVFVSHNLAQVQAICDKAVWLNQGHVGFAGETGQAISRYVAAAGEPSGAMPEYGTENYIRVLGVNFLNEDGDAIEEVVCGSALKVRMVFEARQRLEHPLFVFQFSGLGNYFSAATPQDLKSERPSFPPGVYSIEVSITHFPLFPRKYSLSVVISGPNLIDKYGRVPELAVITVIPRPNQLWSDNVVSELKAELLVTEVERNT